MTKKLRIRLGIFAVVAVLYGLLALYAHACPIKALTGVSCPGCGMTRAWFSVFRLDFAAAFYYHPLFPIAPLIVALILFEDFIPKKIWKIFFAAIIVMFIAVYFMRLFVVKSDIVTVDIGNSVVYKFIRRVLF